MVADTNLELIMGAYHQLGENDQRYLDHLAGTLGLERPEPVDALTIEQRAILWELMRRIRPGFGRGADAMGSRRRSEFTNPYFEQLIPFGAPHVGLNDDGRELLRGALQIETDPDWATCEAFPARYRAAFETGDELSRTFLQEWLSRVILRGEEKSVILCTRAHVELVADALATLESTVEHRYYQRLALDVVPVIAAAYLYLDVVDLTPFLVTLSQSDGLERFSGPDFWPDQGLAREVMSLPRKQPISERYSIAAKLLEKFSFPYPLLLGGRE